QLLSKKYGTQPLFTFATNSRAYVNNTPADRVELSGNSLIVYASYTCEASRLIGDVDMDGSVTAADALEVLKSVVGKVTLTEEQFIAADVDGSGKVDAADALDILKKVVGKIDKFPVEQ
ncbi:MAG: dockerin type I repeat-containing protein, partial [Clostridia bacterium]|nr:dockerin type I repeat-containing protein [Clostridia bacterium]